MLFGGITRERIAISESTLWSGAPSNTDVNPEAIAHLDEIRELLFQGRYVEGDRLCKQYMLGRPESYGTNLPMADLDVDFSEMGSPRHYRRLLDMDKAIARVEFNVNGDHYYREVFASNPAQVIVVHLSCSRPGRISFSASLANLAFAANAVATRHELLLDGHAWEQLHSNGREGVAFVSKVRAVLQSGSIVTNDAELQVQNADTATLLIAVSSSYQDAQYAQSCENVLSEAASRPYEDLRKEHIKDHRSLFRRVSIYLGSNHEQSRLPTDVRRKALASGTDDPDLCALFFQYGRYLTIAGSRANSPLPMALQGIWNDGLASRMGWADDYHLDINTEQNYWATEVCNLPECHEPLFRLIEKIRISGRETAKEMYGTDGWVCHVSTNAWGFTAPGWGLGWGLFVTGGAWIASQMWRHYQFTNDKTFLGERAYPILREAAEFFLAYMVKHPEYGWLVTGPSISPENWFLSPEGTPCCESMGPTCDRVLVHALFTACIEAASILDTDMELRKTLIAARESLPPFQIGKHGQLQEWLEDFDEAQPNHRHTSHLIALYPDDQISPLKTPKLAQAARVTIERRISQPNWEDTEWSRANLVNFFARLFDGEAAHHHLLELLRKDTDDSLLTYSRGGVAGAAQNIFAVDGNCAGTAGIAEMLVQSQGGEIHLLPALPKVWNSGHVHGLRLRGGHQISLSWRNSRLRWAVLIGKTGSKCSVRYAGKVIPVVIGPSGKLRFEAQSFATAI